MRSLLCLGLTFVALHTSKPHGLAAGFDRPLAVGQVVIEEGRYGLFDSLRMAVGYLDAAGFAADFPLFEEEVLTVHDAGRILTVTAENDPHFLGYVSLLTNGVDDPVFYTTEYAGTGSPEQRFWDELAPGSNGIDLEGFEVGTITLTIDRLVIESPGTNPGGDGYWTDMLIAGTLRVYAVPEPSIFALVGIGLLAMLAVRKRKR